MTVARRFSRILNPLVLGSIFAFGALAAGACGDDGDEVDPDEAHLMFVTAPSTTLTAGTAVDVSWMVHTEGELHHTEIRACMGHSADCGLGDMTSFDENFAATNNAGTYEASVSLSVAGPWTIVVFAHVGATPHISEAIHATVE